MRKTRPVAISRMHTTLKVTITISRSFKKAKIAKTLRVVDQGTDRPTSTVTYTVACTRLKTKKKKKKEEANKKKKESKQK